MPYPQPSKILTFTHYFINNTGSNYVKVLNYWSVLILTTHITF